MVRAFFAKLSKGHSFAVWDLFLRIEGRNLFFLRLAPREQFILFSVLIGLFFWLIGISIFSFFQEARMLSQAEEIRALKADHMLSMRQTYDMRNKALKMMDEVSVTQGVLQNLVREESGEKFAEIYGAIQKLGDSRDRFSLDLRAILSSFPRGEVPKELVAQAFTPQSAEKLGNQEQSQFLKASKRLSVRLQETQALLSQAKTEQSSIRGQLSQEISERDKKLENLDLLLTEQQQAEKSIRNDLTLAQAQGKHILEFLDSSYDRYARILTSMAQISEEDSAFLQKRIESTGIKADKLTAVILVKEKSIGGGIEPYGLEGKLEGLPLESRTKIEHLEKLANRVEVSTWNGRRFRRVMETLPLNAPVDEYRVSSQYGRRLDPFTRRWTMHYGLDFASSPGTSVYASSGGKVLFAGWKGAFGRMVVIEHAPGLRTRYGHLRQVLVRSGEIVDKRKKIGIIGSSGRSTGPHLHYEVWFDRKSLDPMRFIQVEKNAHQESSG